MTYKATHRCHTPNFTEKTFANSYKTSKLAKVFSHESLPLYSMSTVLLFMEVTVFLENTNSTFLKLIKVRKANLKRLIALIYKIVQCQILFRF